MAKTPKVKKREVSFRSRAARRGASPPLAKDGVAAKPAPAAKETEYKPWLHSAQNAGITKKQKAKPLKRQQRERQQRAIEKADAVVNKLERKVADSKARSKRVQSRAKAWDELNAKPAVVKMTVGAETLATDEIPEGEEGGEELKMEDVGLAAAESTVTTDSATTKAMTAPATSTAPEADEDFGEVT
ncbi:hypothetical protein LTR53_009339 [Teratosphaeriaceae sp. CCFEE 6253]|nr:hypothetical protein LTR53_009339 [Teratosphaeriaceae sp. CCFEE 6253]